MKVKELIDLMNGFHPDEDVMFCTDDSDRYFRIVGVNRVKTEQNGNVTIDVAWCVRKVRIEVTDEEKLEKKREKLAKKIGGLSERGKYQLRKKIVDKVVRQRTEDDLLTLEILGDEGRKKRGPKGPRKKGVKMRDEPLKGSKPTY